MKTIVSCCLITLLSFSLTVHGQDVHLSQFYQSPAIVNPAYSGTSGKVRAIAAYKNQWASVASPYKTFLLAGDLNITQKKWTNAFLGGGLILYSDKAGDLEYNTTNVGVNVSSGLRLSESGLISIGIQGNFEQRSINTSSLRSDNQYLNGAYDPSADLGESFSSNNQSNVDFALGAQYTYGESENYKLKNGDLSFTLGASYFHLNQPPLSYMNEIDKLSSKLVINASGHISSNVNSFSLIPSLLASFQGSSSEIIIGTLVRNKLNENSKYTGFKKTSSISFGGHYRLKDAFILALLYENSGIGFGISYDINTSSLKTASNGKGGFELSLKFVNL